MITKGADNFGKEYFADALPLERSLINPVSL